MAARTGSATSGHGQVGDVVVHGLLASVRGNLKSIHLWDVAVGELRHILKGQGFWRTLRSMVFSPDDRPLASGEGDSLPFACGMWQQPNSTTLLKGTETGSTVWNSALTVSSLTAVEGKVSIACGTMQRFLRQAPFLKVCKQTLKQTVETSDRKLSRRLLSNPVPSTCPGMRQG